ncbi:MAG: HNH endonuclease [Deltaproteobacteria bacterium]|nr:HNH endonuclease [Deltaproteobacteria bacterium]
MSGTIKTKDQKILCTKSGNRCALPDCRKILVIDGTATDLASLVAEMAHINGEMPGAARYDASMSDIERNTHPNLIFVCPSCHKKIDDQPNKYSVEKLYNIKSDHEEWINKLTGQAVVDVTFAELSIVTKYIMSCQAGIKDSLTLIPPKDKIQKNGLSNNIEQMIMMGMIQVKQVADFVNRCPDIEFGDRLSQGFVLEYERLKNTELMSGDELFNGLLDFASSGATDFKQRAAGLTVLVYLFEKCEVFEK